MNYLLAFDVGTTRTKAVLVTREGRLLAKASATYPVYYPQPRWAEQDPEDWWQAIGMTSTELLVKNGIASREVIGIAFSTQMLNLICLDSRARLLQRGISWLDGRAGAESRKLMRRLGGERVFAAFLGATLTGKDFLPKYFWLKKHDPDLYKQTATIVDASGYLLHRATGQLVCEWGNASVTGLFNLKSKTWDRTLMRFLGVDPAKFPNLVKSTEQVGCLTDDAAAQLGLKSGTPVFAGSGDAMTAAVGSGATSEGEGHLSLGTSGFVGIITHRRVTGRRGMATIQSADAGRNLLIGETETAAECLKWAAREFYGANEEDRKIYQRMDSDVETTCPGADRLLFMPWMYGERAPVPDEKLRAGFINIGAGHTRAQMTRAIYEGVAYNLRWILDSMAELYRFHPDPLRVIGGGARGRPWLQIISNVTGRRLESVEHPQEAGAIGAALLAAVGLGLRPSVESLKSNIEVVDKIEPDTSVVSVYEELYRTFQQCHRSLRSIYHRLNSESGEANSNY